MQSAEDYDVGITGHRMGATLSRGAQYGLSEGGRWSRGWEKELGSSHQGRAGEAAWQPWWEREGGQGGGDRRGGQVEAAPAPPFPRATSGHPWRSGLLLSASPFHSQKRPSFGVKIVWAPQVQASVSSFCT